MSSRIRNSESQRGMKGETLPQADTRERHPRPGKSHSSFRGVNPSKWSGLEANNALKSDDCSAWPSWESPPPDNNVKRDDDPAFDGRGRQHHSRPSNDSWSQPQRVRGSVRNRSRDRDRSRSRSRSRSRGRVKVRGRSRSRSRSWDRGEGGERGRSRSPFHDDRHESYDNIDKGSGARLSSRVCRDFAMGKCRRGSNCRFLHQENLNSQGGRHFDNDVTERSGSRPEYGGASRYGDNRDSVDHTLDKVSDGSRRYSGKDEPDSTDRSSSRPDYGGASRYGDNRSSADRPRDDGARRYNVEDESVRDSIKDTFCCKEFQKGRCRYGASCRYPHHAVSEDNHNRGNRNASYNHDGKGPPSRSGKVPCKYFLSGNCHREDCRFSHDAPMSEGVDGRSRDDRLGNIADEKTKSWNGPTWDEVTPGLTNTTKPTGRRDSSFHNLNPHDSASYEKHADIKNNSWNGPTWDEVNEPDLSDIAKSTRQPDTSVRNLNSYDSEAYDKHMDENKPWSGMTWDETSAPGLSDATKSVEWGERSVGNIKPHDSVAIGKHSGARGGHGWENSRPMDGPVWNEKTVERNEYISPGASMDAYMGTNEYRSMKKLDGNEEGQLVFDRSRSQTLDGISMPSHERNIMLDTSGCELATTVMQAHAPEISYRYGRDNPATFDDSNVLDVDMVSEDTTYPVLTPKKVFSQSGHSMGYQSPSNLGGIEQSRPTNSLNTLNRPNIDFSGSVHDIYPPLTQPMQTRLDRNEAGEAQGLLEQGVRQVMPEMSETVVSSEQVAQMTDLPAILNQISQNGQLPQIIAALNPNSGMGLVHSVPSSASVVPPVPMFVPPSMDMNLKEQYDPARESMAIKRHGSNNEPSGVFSTSMGKENDVPGEEHQKSPKSKQQGPGVSEEVKNIEQKSKQEQEKYQAGSSDARGNVEEGSISNDEKAMRLFKIALVDFVKEILKPTWKEGGMSREVHKAVVKKVVDKVTSTVQGIQIPRTPEKIEQYLAFSKSKISKLVTAYVERLSKPADA